MAAPTIIPSNWAAPAYAARQTVNVDAGLVVPLEQYYISKEIYEKNVEARPFTVLLESIGAETGWNDTVFWDEDVPVPQSDTLDGSVAVGSVTVVVTNGNYFSMRDNIYFHQNRAQGHVIGKVGNTLTVAWVAAPTTPILDGATVVRISNSQHQIDIPSPAPTTVPEQLYNRYQIMIHEVAASLMHIHGKFMQRPDDWTRQQRKILQEHLTEKEKTTIFGQMALWAAGPAAAPAGTPMGHMQGLYYFIGTNVTSLNNAVLTRAAFDTFLRGVMSANTHDNQDWWFFCSSRIASQISGWFAAIEREQSSQTLFGVRVQTYRAPVFKDVKIVVHPIFDREGFDDLGILVNMGEKCLQLTYHSVFRTRKYTATQPYGRTAMEIFFMTIWSLIAKGEEINCGVIEDVAEAA